MSEKTWNVVISRDSAVPSLGLHGLHVAFRGLPHVEVGGFFDSRADDLESIMAATQAKRHYRNYVEMLDTEKPDIVVICSRHPNDHFDQIIQAAERGIHIYCEKPMTVSLAEADAIIECLEKTGVKLCMAHPARYDAHFLQMKNMIEAGEIGKPMTVYGRGKSDHRGGGEDLMVLGTHILDVQTWMFGQPESVWAEVLTEGQAIKAGVCAETVEPIGPTAGDHVFASFRFPHEVRGLFESRRGLVSDPHRQRGRLGLSVIGTKGTLSLRFDDMADATLKWSRLSSPPDDDALFEEVPVIEGKEVPGALPLEYSLLGNQTPMASMFLKSNRYAAWDLMQSILTDRQPVSNMMNARVALEMIYGIYASQLSESVIRFPLTHREHPLEMK
ncbi:Gfo/Idh/MocA family oxidoreductase [Kiritimatiellota bacterium B12222]|nr:Gfo/Idh/MocA family oxidoreductase [Kiritimatiellota bacterium B12222]